MPIDLLSSPRCRADQLGLPMPDDVHAVSSCLPLWEHNVGYEEGLPEVIDQLQAAYPRFCFHPLIQQLCDQLFSSPGHQGLPFVSPAAAKRAVEYVRHAGNVEGTIVPLKGQTATGVSVPAEHFATLKQYWQHAGENVSSRAAEQILAGEAVTCTATQSRLDVRQRVAEFQMASVDDVFLFPSGMAAIAAARRAANGMKMGASCQFGFPYVDTLKMQQRFPGASPTFFPIGDEADLQRLEKQCQKNPPSVVFCEVPTNPLLVTPNLTELRQLADTYDFVLIVDDTLAACGNLETLRYSDLLVTSLTKYFSGQGNVLAGTMVVNPNGKHASDLLQFAKEDFEETLCDADVAVLCKNSADYRERVAQINSNAVELAAFLKGHPAVASVFFPDADDANYRAIKRQGGGYGGLLSIVLKDAAGETPAVFNALNICKGPNLGTVFTLCCPYTILAHFDELDFAEECGVSRWLLRISIGIEPIDELKQRFQEALTASC